MQRKGESILEQSFRINFQKRFESAGFTFQTQQKIPPHLLKYDVKLQKGFRTIYIELDGHGMGHTSVKARERDARKGNLAVQTGAEFYRLSTKHFNRGLPANYTHELVDWIINKGERRR